MTESSSRAANVDAPTPDGDIDTALSHEESRLLRILLRSDAPIGARAATRLLAADGIALSEATASRIFSRLDDLGFTEPMGRKGRVLTAGGRRMTASAAIADRRNGDLRKALDIQSVHQLLDLLRARRGVERELARSAALHATAAYVDRLERAIGQQKEVIATGESPQQRAMGFHRIIAEMSQNPLLAAISETLWNDSLVPLEKILDVVTAGHGTVEDSLPEHVQILDRLRAGDPDGAESAMDAHHSRLIAEVEEFAASDKADLFSRLIQSFSN